MDISLNAKVMCTDGPCGNLNHVILKSANEEITHLIIKYTQDHGTEYVVPIDRVLESNRDQIQLNCARSELKSMPTFTQEEYIPRSVFTFQINPYLITPHAVLPGPYIPMEVERIPAGELAVKKGANVIATDGQVGFVDEFLMNPEDNSLSHLILRKGHFWGQEEVTIPIDQIDHMEEDTVRLKIGKKEVESLPAIPIQRFWTKKE